MPRTPTLNTPKKVFKVGVLEPPLLRLKTPTLNTELIKHDLGWPSVNSAWMPGGPRPRTLDAKQPQTTEREFARAGGGQITSDFAQRAADTSVSAGIFAHDTEFISWSHLARSGAATGLQAPAAHASLAPRNTGKSSVGNCRRLQQSDGPWFDSGWPDASGVLRSTWRSHSSAG